MKKGGSATERFAAAWTPEPNTGCWLWLNGLNSAGYGRVMDKYRSILAHRFSWELHRGPIPDGMYIDHRCRVRSCVNPDHLRVVTPAQNTLENNDCYTAVAKRKTHCKRGHSLTPDNLRPTNRGRRECRICHRIHTRRHWLAGEKHV